MSRQLQTPIAALATAALFVIAGCDSTPSAPENADAPATATPSYDPTEQALIGSAIKRAEKGAYTAKLMYHHLSKTSSTMLMCGAYTLQDDSSGRVRYFISTSSGAILLDSPDDARWKKDCAN